MSRTIRFGVIERNLIVEGAVVEVIWTHSWCHSRDLHPAMGETHRRVRASFDSRPLRGAQVVYQQTARSLLTSGDGAGVREQGSGITAGGSPAAENPEAGAEHWAAAACNPTSRARIGPGADPSGDDRRLPSSSSRNAEAPARGDPRPDRGLVSL